MGISYTSIINKEMRKASGQCYHNLNPALNYPLIIYRSGQAFTGIVEQTSVLGILILRKDFTMEKEIFYINAQKFYVEHSPAGHLVLFADVSGMKYYISNCLTVSQAKQLAKIWMGINMNDSNF